MSLNNVVEALKTLSNEDDDDTDTSVEESDGKTGGFFCEGSFFSRDVRVSVSEIGLISFPINGGVIKNLIDISEKAKFGKGLKTVLDTTYRDTQMIPAKKLEVVINEQALDKMLQHIAQELRIEEYSRLEIHLYNMLIYGPGQFFKRHRDTEKVPNMVATMVMVLPSVHRGGDLIIEHLNLNHRFFGSLDHEIIKCVTFYSDCYHEVKEVDEGYRVALTYNVELKPGPIPDLMSVDENIQDAVNNYFEEGNSNKLVYFLNHQYTEHSLRWYLLKGSDRIWANALLAVGKLEGYSPCLALAEYHESWPEGCESSINKTTKLYFWIDENNIHFDSEQISVSENQICFMKDTKEEFDPYKREEEGHMGNWAGNIDEWYHRSAVVLWKDTWSFVNGFKKEFHALHQMTAQPGMQATLLRKIMIYSEKLFSSPFWDDTSVKKMALDIMMHLNNNEIMLKILSILKPSDVLDLAKNEVVSWLATNCDLETWHSIIETWKSKHDSEVLLDCLLPFLLNYMSKEDKDLGVAEYLLNEAAKVFMTPKISYRYSYSASNCTSDKDKLLCSLLQICHDLGNVDLEEKLMKNVFFKSSVAYFKMFEKMLQPEQFARISGDLLLNMTDASLGKMKKEKYIYAGANQTYVEEICSLLKACGKLGNRLIEQKIFNHILFSPHIYSVSFLVDLLIKMQQVLGDYVCYYADFKNQALIKIEAELEKFQNSDDFSLPINHPCSCGFCKEVKEFFASPTEKELVIPTAQYNRKHIYSYLNPFAECMPIKLETLRYGSPYKLTVTKLPKLLVDRQIFTKKLVQKRNLISSEPEEIIVIYLQEPETKKSRTE